MNERPAAQLFLAVKLQIVHGIVLDMVEIYLGLNTVNTENRYLRVKTEKDLTGRVQGTSLSTVWPVATFLKILNSVKVKGTPRAATIRVAAAIPQNATAVDRPPAWPHASATPGRRLPSPQPTRWSLLS